LILIGAEPSRYWAWASTIRSVLICTPSLLFKPTMQEFLW